MDLRQYVHALRKGWWIIAVVAVLGLAGGLLATLRATPMYASTVTFFISTPTEGSTTALSADQFATRRITSYVGLLSSDVTAQRIIEKTGVDLTVSQLSSRITGDADLNTVLLTATATDSSPDRSLAIARGIAENFGAIVDEVDPIGPSQVELRVISGPTLNPSPVSPKKAFNLAIGLVLGLIVGVVTALLRSVLDTTIRQVAALRSLTGVPVLGVIPANRQVRKNPVLPDIQGQSIHAEAVRQLRTNLQYVDVDKPVQVLVVTSAVAGEGKSATSANLAASSARAAGRRVIVVEADLRRPQLSSYLDLEREVGLTSVLTGRVALEDALQSWGTHGLTVLSSGPLPPNPAELVESAAMTSLLNRLRDMFDLIIIDTPPLLPVTDGAVLARKADGAVLVVRYGKTARNQVASAIRSMRSVDARVLGTVLTLVPPKGIDGYEGYQGNYRSATDPSSTGSGDGADSPTERWEPVNPVPTEATGLPPRRPRGLRNPPLTD